MAGAACRRHDERGCLLVVEGAQALLVGPCLPQGHKLRHTSTYVGGVFDLLYVCLSIIMRASYPATHRVPQAAALWVGEGKYNNFICEWQGLDRRFCAPSLLGGQSGQRAGKRKSLKIHYRPQHTLIIFCSGQHLTALWSVFSGFEQLVEGRHDDAALLRAPLARCGCGRG
jgi:hypothetical protein